MMYTCVMCGDFKPRWLPRGYYVCNKCEEIEGLTMSVEITKKIATSGPEHYIYSVYNNSILIKSFDELSCDYAYSNAKELKAQLEKEAEES